MSCLDVLHDPLDHIAGDRPFGARSLDPTADFFAVQWLPGFVPFYHPDTQLLDLLKCREPPLTSAADAFSANHIATLGSPRVQNAVIVDVAIRDNASLNLN